MLIVESNRKAYQRIKLGLYFSLGQELLGDCGRNFSKWLGLLILSLWVCICLHSGGVAEREPLRCLDRVSLRVALERGSYFPKKSERNCQPRMN